MPSPTSPSDGELSAIVNGPGNPLVRLWLKPLETTLPMAAATWDKPLGELTVPEVLAWAMVLGYVALTGAILGTVAGNVLRVAALGR